MKRPFRYLSTFSGIEAASVAWEPLGWRPAAFAEVDPFASAVLEARFPQVRNLGDVTQFRKWPDLGPINLLVGGSPCQAFSVAGLQHGLADPRGNLALTYLSILDRLRPEWVVWENVPGSLSSNEGRDFGTLLGALAHIGYGFAYRVLDAQYFGVAQRRRRVFLVGNARDWRLAASVLFEPQSLSGHSPQIKAQRKVASSGPRQSTATAMFWNGEQVTQTLDAVLAKGQMMPEKSRFPAVLVPRGAASTGLPFVKAKRASSKKDDESWQADRPAPTLSPFDQGDKRATVAIIEPDDHFAVRRLTPRECERLQGFPDDWTAIPYKRNRIAGDTLRYKAIGNSMAVPVMRWLGERIQAVHEAQSEAYDPRKHYSMPQLPAGSRAAQTALWNDDD